jgi:hypothetical protein
MCLAIKLALGLSVSSIPQMRIYFWQSETDKLTKTLKSWKANQTTQKITFIVH